ncbi:MAG: hypothetical protein QM755_02710 [Luteolibacter sp.]
MTRAPIVLLLAACLATLASCAPRTAPLPVMPIPKAVPVAPAVAAIRPGLDRAADAAAALQARGDSLERIATRTREEALRLAKAGAATREELTRQADATTRITEELRAEKADKARLTQALDESRSAQADALAAASQGDSAAHLLTRQLQSITAQYQQAESSRQSLTATLAVKDDRIQRLTRLLILLGGTALLYIAARLFKTTPTGRLWLFWLP